MINIYTSADIDKITDSAILLSDTLDMVRLMIKPGTKVKDIEEFAETYIRDNGGKPAFKGYKGYPSALCISVESVAAHGIPDDRILRDGQIVSVDGGVELDGWFSDSARTFEVGTVSDEKRRLIDATRQAMNDGIEQIKPGNKVGDISHAIEQRVVNEGFAIVHALGGHGIGKNIHEDPKIFNFGQAGTGSPLVEGMVLAIEPVVSMGKPELVMVGQ